jgi:phenylacetate-coenzyme A ligase PaaK-like adenylate-forming protein
LKSRQDKEHLNNFNSFSRKLYEVNDGSFADIALELFRFQAKYNPVYAQFLSFLKADPGKINQVEKIPFLPVSFFKRHAIQTGSWNSEIIFTSSGTSGTTQSRHVVHDLEFYLQHSRKCFELQFGPLENYHFLALLPSYLEREGSSLIYMMEHFIKNSNSSVSGFYLKDLSGLLERIHSLKGDGRRVIVWGVTFALLELAEQFTADLSHCLIFETGGMKGRRKEITRSEFYDVLRTRLKAREIYSEYGMTELMSQAYTRGDTRFQNPPFLKILGRDLSDPFEKGVINETCGINVVDLANFHSIAFLETEDLGKIYRDGSFEILGRIDNSDVRGCNLMV